MFYLVTGGSGSGKSVYAESIVESLGHDRRIYLATMFPFDEESKKRVSRHQEMRKNKGFETIEQYTGIDRVMFTDEDVVLLECMSNLVANEMYQKTGAGNQTVESVLSGIHRMLDQAAHVVIVTNEVFSDIVPLDEETDRYLMYLGAINQKLADMADDVTEVVYGIPVKIKQEGTN